MTQKKKPDLVQITEKEFLDLLFNNADKYNNQIYELRKARDKFYDLYRSYAYDKPVYTMKFFIQDNTLFYEKFKKPSMGYKRGNQNGNESK